MRLLHDGTQGKAAVLLSKELFLTGHFGQYAAGFFELFDQQGNFLAVTTKGGVGQLVFHVQNGLFQEYDIGVGVLVVVYVLTHVGSVFQKANMVAEMTVKILNLLAQFGVG